MKTHARHLVLSALVLLSGCVVAACGDDQPSGEQPPPAGFKTYEGLLVSFAYPGDWTVVRQPTGSESTKVLVQPRSGTAPKPTIQLNEDPNLRGTFDAVLKAQASSSGAVGGRDATTEDVEVDGAERGVRFTGTSTVAGTTFDSAGIAVLTTSGGGAFLSAIIPPGQGQPDIDAIIDSLRLMG